MIRPKVRFSVFSLICLYSVFLIAAGLSRYMETDSGNILIHDITAESYEGFPYGVRLFRPLQANSLNLRPAILLVTGNAGDRYTCDHIAMEFARRGFVTLTMEDFGRGSTPSEPDYETENLVDAGYTFLATRSFTDHSRIGLAVFYSGAAKALESKYLPEFTDQVFISPESGLLSAIPEAAGIFTAKYEFSPEYRIEGTEDKRIREFPEIHTGMIADRSVISQLLERFHGSLAIPNDSPFWFDAGSQHAQLLLVIRYILFLLLFAVCAGLSALLTAGTDKPLLRAIAGILLPLILFLISSGLMNFFIVSVRLGSPFHYLPKPSQIPGKLNIPVLLCFIAAAVLSGLPFRKGKGLRFISDIAAMLGILLCAVSFIPAFFGYGSGRSLLDLGSLRFGICLITGLAFLHSLLLRIPAQTRLSRMCCVVLNGIMFYIYCCDLPAAVLF